MPPKLKHYRKLLGVGPDATADDLRQAWRRLALKYHPDVCGGDKKDAERRFRELNEAYRALCEAAGSEEQAQEDIESLRGVPPEDLVRGWPWPGLPGRGERKPRGRWRRPSRRTAVWLVVGCVFLLSIAALAVIAVQRSRAQARRRWRLSSEHRAAERIPKAIAGARLAHLQQIDLSSTDITDADLVHLKGLMALRTLNLAGTQITDAALVHLKGLTGLQKLDLGFTKITGPGLVHLKDMAELQTLDVRWTRTTDAALVHLKGLTGLQKLDLEFTKITDAGLVDLNGLTGLRTLNLGGTQITDAGLVHLEGLTGLQKLYLRWTRITDAGLVHLRGLTRLRTLDLSTTQITDAGVVHLKGMTELQEINLDYTHSTEAGLAELRKALPRTQVGK